LVKSFNVVLISTYDLGHQPFSIAVAAALVGDAGASVCCNDLAVDDLACEDIINADLIALHLPMHTATRLALRVLPRIMELNSAAAKVCYGNYAVMNEAHLRSAGVNFICGGEGEARLAEICTSLMAGMEVGSGDTVRLERQRYPVPDRSGLLDLSQYAHLLPGEGAPRMAGYTETTSGCKHLCNHCPVVPVYQGKFFVVDRAVVLQDIEQQVRMGAEHITFGDPDFFNGPGHGMRIVDSLAERHPNVTYDVTIKVEHLLKHAKLLPRLRDTGCLFVTTAVESFDERILQLLNKGHTRSDFAKVVVACEKINLNLAPTFVAFTPWTTSESYLEFLRDIVRFNLVSRVPTVQYGLRLLVPQGSYLLQQDCFRHFLGRYNADALSYGWHYEKPLSENFEIEVRHVVEGLVAKGFSVRAAFQELWKIVHAMNGVPAPALPLDHSMPTPTMSEAWYCCAEPTEAQLNRF
jgi:radical SAM superfamily enzyme YgiQ (UPF0313 family)